MIYNYMLFRISATEAARNLSDIINRIRYRGDEFIVERGGEAVCRIVPTMPSYVTGHDLKKAFAAIPKPDHAYWDLVADAIQTQPPPPDLPWPR